MTVAVPAHFCLSNRIHYHHRRRHRRYGFLLDPSPLIGYACHSLTHSLTHSFLVNLIDVTLACEDAYSILVEVFTVVDVDDEKRCDYSFMQIWKLKFGHKSKFCSDFENKVWSRV